AQHLELQPFGFCSVEFRLSGAKPLRLGLEVGGIALIETWIGERGLQVADLALQRLDLLRQLGERALALVAQALLLLAGRCGCLFLARRRCLCRGFARW